jgi:hypothetical protein
MIECSLIFRNIDCTLWPRGSPIFPCSESIEWVVDRTLTNGGMCVDALGNHVGSFISEHMNTYYKFMRPKVSLDTTFLNKFYDDHDVGKILSGWWKEDKKFVNQDQWLVCHY